MKGFGIIRRICSALLPVNCNVVGSKGSIMGLSVGDCSFRMSLWFLAVRSISSSSSVQGCVWSV